MAEIWSNSPWRVKILLALTLLIFTTALASLSETVFKWKGFILDAMSFYKSTVKGPLEKLLSQAVNSPIPPGLFDTMVFAGLLLAVATRVRMHQPPHGHRRHIFAIVAVAVFVFVYWGMLLANQPTSAFAMFIVYCVVSLDILRTTRGTARLLAMVYAIGPLALVGVLGAVNAGLMRQ